MSSMPSTRPSEPNLPKESQLQGARSRKDHTIGHVDPHGQTIWDHVSSSPVHSMWDFQGTPALTIAKRTFTAFNEDNLLSRAAELGYYFLFALFPTLLAVSAVVGLFAKSAGNISVQLLHYLSLVVPNQALGMVLDTFNQTTAHSSGGKVTFGLAAALWSASVGFTAIQDTLNTVYKARENRPYWKVRGTAILVTVLLAFIIMATLGSLLAGTLLSHLVRHHVWHAQLGTFYGIAIHLFFDALSLALCLLLFATIYYFAPNVKNKHFRYFTPGAVIGIVGWIASSLALRLYLHFFSTSYSVTYGSLGAVILLLTWFYVTGLMLLIGAEVNSEIEAASAEAKLKASGTLPQTTR